MVTIVLLLILFSGDSTLDFQNFISEIALDIKFPKFFRSENFPLYGIARNIVKNLWKS